MPTGSPCPRWLERYSWGLSPPRTSRWIFTWMSGSHSWQPQPHRSDATVGPGVVRDRDNRDLPPFRGVTLIGGPVWPRVGLLCAGSAMCRDDRDSAQQVVPVL